MGLFSFAAVISRPFFGNLVASKGEYPVMSFGIIVALIASLGYSRVTEFGFVMLFIRIVHGIGFSAFIAGGFAFVARSFHPGKRGEVFGVLGACLMGSVALAPLLGEYLIRKWGFYGLYTASSTSIALAWVAAFLGILPPSTPPQGKKSAAAVYFRLLKDNSFIFLLISTIIFSHCQSTVSNFLALIAAEKEVSAGPFFLVSYATAIPVLLIMGKFIDRYGKMLFLRTSYPLFSLSILLIPWLISSSFFPVSAFLYGVGMGLLFPVHNAPAAGHGRKTEKPAVMSLFTAVYDTGFITGAAVSGWFSHQTGVESLFMFCGLLGLAGFIMVMIAPIIEKADI